MERGGPKPASWGVSVFHGAGGTPDDEQHDVDHDTGDRDVDPNRESPSGDTPMSNELSTDCPPQRQPGQKGHRRGQCHVRDENEEVHGPDQPRATETLLLPEKAIGQIAAEEENGHAEGGDHTSAVPHDVVVPDRVVSDQQEDQTDRIQSGVNRR